MFKAQHGVLMFDIVEIDPDDFSTVDLLGISKTKLGKKWIFKNDS
jgi:hypothetical protein